MHDTVVSCGMTAMQQATLSQILDDLLSAEVALSSNFIEVCTAVLI